jgi:hypothetical protein
MLAARITLPHFSISPAMNLPKSADELANTHKQDQPTFDLGRP